MAANEIKLSEHPRGYRKAMGKQPNGNPKVFYFGHDKRDAQRRAALVHALFLALKAESGADAWTDAYLEQAERIIEGKPLAPISAAPAVVAHVETAKPSKGKGTLHQAIDGMILKVESESGRREATRLAIAQRLQTLRRLLPDHALSHFGKVEIEEAVERLIARPKSLKTDKRMAFKSVRDLIQYLSRLLEWLDGRAEFGWSMPLGVAKIVKDKRAALARMEADAEDDATDGRDDSTVETYSVAELGKIYKAASARERLWLLLGLNCGFTQTDLATLKAKHLHLAAKTPHIKRRRNKTRGALKVAFIWALWQETADALKKQVTPLPNLEPGYSLIEVGGVAKVKHKKLGIVYDSVEDYAKDRDTTTTPIAGDDLVFLGANDNPLVWWSGRSRVDAVTNAWQDLLEHSEIKRRLPFGVLRKTGSQLVRNAGGREMSEAFLAHTDKTMGKHYNLADFNRLARTLRKVRAKLQPMIDAAAKAEDEKAA